MKIRISRSRSHHGGQYYMLKDDVKISPDGGWCINGFLEMFGNAFRFREGQGVNIEIKNSIANSCVWNIIQGISNNYESSEIKYPTYAQHTNGNIVI